MNTAPNFDHVLPAERLSSIQRKPRNWPMFAFIVSVCLLAYNDVAWRDERTALIEKHQAEIVAKDREIALRRGEPLAKKCHDYVVSMEGWTLVHCIKPAVRL